MRLSKSHKKSEMSEITWNAARLRISGVPGNRLLITQTGLISLTRQRKGKCREYVFPSDWPWRVPVVDFTMWEHCLTAQEVCEVISEQQLGSLQAKCAELRFHWCPLFGELLWFMFFLVSHAFAVWQVHVKEQISEFKYRQN